MFLQLGNHAITLVLQHSQQNRARCLDRNLQVTVTRTSRPYNCNLAIKHFSVDPARNLR